MPGPDARRLAAEAAAADWLIAADRGWTEAERRDFERWLAADPLHAEAWAEAELMWARLDRADEAVVADRLPAPTRRMARRGFPILAIAAAAAVMLAGGLWWTGTGKPSERLGRVVHVQPRLQALADGSTVELNADAEIQTEFAPGLRRVRLIRGEAHFDVMKDAARPFEVEADGVAIRALGTAFNVRLGQGRVGVLVTSGRVEVTAPAGTGVAVVEPAPRTATMLEAQQQVIVPLGEAVPLAVTTLTPADLGHSLAWRGLRLRFEDMPLAEVAAEFNRFSPARSRPHLVVDASAAGVLVAGTFRADNVDVFLRFLERGFEVKVEPRSDGTILLRQGP